jgi:hypothetical protein
LIPTTSVDQYAATLAQWFGVSDAECAALFPNLGNFNPKNLGFFKAPTPAATSAAPNQAVSVPR